MNRNNSDPKTITAAEMSIDGAPRGEPLFLSGETGTLLTRPGVVIPFTK